MKKLKYKPLILDILGNSTSSSALTLPAIRAGFKQRVKAADPPESLSRQWKGVLLRRIKELVNEGKVTDHGFCRFSLKRKRNPLRISVGHAVAGGRTFAKSTHQRSGRRAAVAHQADESSEEETETEPERHHRYRLSAGVKQIRDHADLHYPASLDSGFSLPLGTPPLHTPPSPPSTTLPHPQKRRPIQPETDSEEEGGEEENNYPQALQQALQDIRRLRNLLTQQQRLNTSLAAQHRTAQTEIKEMTAHISSLEARLQDVLLDTGGGGNNGGGRQQDQKGVDDRMQYGGIVASGDVGNNNSNDDQESENIVEEYRRPQANDSLDYIQFQDDDQAVGFERSSESGDGDLLVGEGEQEEEEKRELEREAWKQDLYGVHVEECEVEEEDQQMQLQDYDYDDDTVMRNRGSAPTSTSSQILHSLSTGEREAVKESGSLFKPLTQFPPRQEQRPQPDLQQQQHQLLTSSKSSSLSPSSSNKSTHGSLYASHEEKDDADQQKPHHEQSPSYSSSIPSSSTVLTNEEESLQLVSTSSSSSSAATRTALQQQESIQEKPHSTSQQSFKTNHTTTSSTNTSLSSNTTHLLLELAHMSFESKVNLELARILLLAGPKDSSSDGNVSGGNGSGVHADDNVMELDADVRKDLVSAQGQDGSALASLSSSSLDPNDQLPDRDGVVGGIRDHIEEIQRLTRQFAQTITAASQSTQDPPLMMDNNDSQLTSQNKGDLAYNGVDNSQTQISLLQSTLADSQSQLKSADEECAAVRVEAMNDAQDRMILSMQVDALKQVHYGVR